MVPMSLSPSSVVDFIQAPARQYGSLAETSHRPWPVPERSWLQGQTWDELLFMHWRVGEDEMRELLPESLPPDTHDGSAWIGITPFRVSGLRLHGLPPVPVLSTFPEVNVRTYVTYDGKPGIWFFSLDADSPWAVDAARLTYRLPYHKARIDVGRRAGWIDYRSARTGARLDVSYRPDGEATASDPGTLEHFLTERYCLYTEHHERLHRAEIHHGPWRVQPAEAEVRKNTMSPVALEGEPLLYYSARQDVVIWPLERLQEGSAK
jgi:uncharacterized protein YqjF (DUF2071 family)